MRLSMTQDEYVRNVDTVLNAHADRARLRLTQALSVVPPQARRITIDIFVDQGGEGFLTVRVGLDGPDLYVLQRVIAEHAELFTTRMTPTGLEPPLPLMNGDEEAFSVHDTLTDCAARWVASLWNQIERHETRLPVSIESPEEYGTVTPMRLIASGGG